MKRLLLVIILVGLGVAAWFGYGQWQRSVMLHSGRNLLLINRSAKLYTYSNALSPNDNIANYTVAGYADQMTPDQQARLTAGLYYSAAQLSASGESNVSGGSADLPIPSPDEQQKWAAALTTVTAPQQALCQSLPDAVSQQYCLARHYEFNAWRNHQDASICDAIYIAAEKQECVADLSKQGLQAFTDNNNNQLLDLFELQGNASADAYANANFDVINLN